MWWEANPTGSLRALGASEFRSNRHRNRETHDVRPGRAPELGVWRLGHCEHANTILGDWLVPVWWIDRISRLSFTSQSVYSPWNWHQSFGWKTARSCLPTLIAFSQCSSRPPPLLKAVLMGPHVYFVEALTILRLSNMQAIVDKCLISAGILGARSIEVATSANRRRW